MFFICKVVIKNFLLILILLISLLNIYLNKNCKYYRKIEIFFLFNFMNIELYKSKIIKLQSNKIFFLFIISFFSLSLDLHFAAIITSSFDVNALFSSNLDQNVKS